MSDNRTLFRPFARIGLLSFGGPAAQIALMHRVLVEEQAWLTEKQFLSALSFCMLLPGPEAMQLATYAGWRLNGVRGGLLAGLLFVLPGAVVMLALASVYAFYGAVPLVVALFTGIKAAVLVIVVDALLRIGRKALQGPAAWALAMAAFLALFVFRVPYPLVVLVAALVGAVAFARPADPAPPVTVSLRHTVLTAALWLAIWLLPILALDFVAGTTVLPAIGAFFSRLAVVTFGGAYAVLAYMAQDVVEAFGWLTAGEMMDGLGLAETTPGPLILVTQFVGFLAGFRDGGFAMALAATAVTLWATFVPCFAWIFTGAPYVEWISAQPRLAGALAGIMAAVVGVIANLSLWFALHVLFAGVDAVPIGPAVIWSPDLATVQWPVVALSLLAALTLLGLRWPLVRVLALCAASGLALSFL